jgi:amidase
MFTDYDAHDAVGLAALIASGQVSAAEVLEAALAKIDKGEPLINAIAVDARAHARCQAISAGPFAGVPFLLKDLAQPLAGLKSTSGCRAMRDYVAPRTAEITARFMRSGMVVMGLTTTPELGLKATTETLLHGDTRNPWDLARTPGGSSGGAGAAVAAGYVPMAGASDGGGSIRIPAAYNGLFGLKPSRGRVPAGPDGGEGWDGATVAHVLSRSVRDSAVMLDAIAGPDVGAPFHIAPPERPFAAELGAKVERLRIGFSTASPMGGRVDPEHVKAVETTARLLESLGHDVEEAAPAVDGKALARCFFTMYYGQVAASVAAIRRLTGAAESAFHSDTRTLALLGRALSAESYVSRRAEWNGFARAAGAFFETFDIFLTPTTAMGPAKIGELDTPKRDAAFTRLMIALRSGGLLLKTGLAEAVALKSFERTPFTILANLTFCPAMSVPLHWGADGLPVGVQFGAKSGAEGLLIRLASQLEAAQPWFGRRPPGF